MLSVSLVVAFCFTPSVSKEIFSSWDCESFSYDDKSEHSFLKQDLAVQCNGSREHNEILVIAWILTAVWPIGMVAIYGVLLLWCYTPLQNSEFDDPLVQATAFLHRDYRPK